MEWVRPEAAQWIKAEFDYSDAERVLRTVASAERYGPANGGRGSGFCHADRPAASGSTTANVFDAILNKPRVPPRQVNANVPLELERIIQKVFENRKRSKKTVTHGISTPLKSGAI